MEPMTDTEYQKFLKDISDDMAKNITEEIDAEITCGLETGEIKKSFMKCRRCKKIIGYYYRIKDVGSKFKHLCECGKVIKSVIKENK